VDPGYGGGFGRESRSAFFGEGDEDCVEEDGRAAGELEVGCDHFTVFSFGAADARGDDGEIGFVFVGSGLQGGDQFGVGAVGDETTDAAAFESF
jgi:hypothetical protein